MKVLMSHHVNECNRQITVEAQDAPGAGGASTMYIIKGPQRDYGGGVGVAPAWGVNLRFQRGDPAVEINGCTNESLLAIVEDRLKGFQSGPFACDDNQAALVAVQSALAILARRSAEREARGVEGQQKP